ncbi:ATP-binding protein [Patescibacteria group bacterium]|nr:ATP-binding protein [Patescibacteria group bacterium]MBU1123951.1 ATP-binding protein [Patescibacteria group bacterium]MBU1911576.1 ATP-binding protein [Patescibacteria group bacterium]
MDYINATWQFGGLDGVDLDTARRELEEKRVEVSAEPDGRPDRVVSPIVKSQLYAVRQQVLDSFGAVEKHFGIVDPDPKTHFRFELASEEAFLNAVIHGAEGDPSKTITVYLKIFRDKANKITIELVVQDPGPGFDSSVIPDPTEDDNLDVPTGRGLLLIDSFMDEVERNPDGNCVTMRKRFEAAAEKEAVEQSI